MKAGHKFLIGAALIVASVGFLIAAGREGDRRLLPHPHRAGRQDRPPTRPSDDVGFKVGAKVVPGSVRRDNASRQVDFQVSDGVKTYPVTYHGLVPDTFTDANDIEVVVEGRLGRDGVFRATEVLAKCGSRYEAATKSRKRSAHDTAGTVRALGRLPARPLGRRRLVLGPLARPARAGRQRHGRRSTRSSRALVVASLALWKGLVTHDFNIEYVAAYTSRNLPSGYIFSAFWAGQKGSLLFWAVVLSLFAALAQLLTAAALPAAPMPYVAGVTSAVVAFFVSIMLFAANPFERLAFTPADGRGLNPQLQNVGMVIHPADALPRLHQHHHPVRLRHRRAALPRGSTPAGSTPSGSGPW